MALISIGDYQVEIFNDSVSNYSENDNIHKYDFVYKQVDGYQCSTIIGIKIYENNGYENDVILKSALIGASGGRTGVYENSFVFELNKIIICCSDTVFCLSIPDLSLLWKAQADMACCFEIFKYKTDFIVHGELEITRLGEDGRIIWQRGGTDIFTRLNSEKDDFSITENFILATDWDNRKYKFDLDGNQIE
jgi:hypothetical protein